MDLFQYVEPYKVLICKEHRQAIMPRSLYNHLLREHRLSASTARNLHGVIVAEHNLIDPSNASQVLVPTDPVPAFDHLEILAGWKCMIEGCDQEPNAISRCQTTVFKHRAASHRGNFSRGQGIVPIHVQTFFQFKALRRYFEVNPSPGLIGDIDASDKKHLYDEFDRFQEQWNQAFDKIAPVSHQSEQTPWLRMTGYSNHLSGQNKAQLQSMCCLPSTDETELQGLLDVTSRMLQTAERQATYGSPHCLMARADLRTLGTFHRGDQNPSPFQPVQNQASLDKYINHWLGLICYIHRIGSLEDALVRLTPSQKACYEEAIDAVVYSQQHSSRESSIESLGRASATATAASGAEHSSSQPPSRCHLHRRPHSPVDNMVLAAVLKFNLSLIQQNLYESAFDSPMMSYSAIKALKADGSWVEPGNHTSFLAALTHCIQLFFVAELYSDKVRMADPSQLSCYLKSQCERWVLNDSRGPLAEILQIRLYGSQIGRNALAHPWVAWSEDQQTITYRSTQMHLPSWKTMLAHLASATRQHLHEKLLFSARRRPVIVLDNLLDVTTESRPGFSFVSDPRNGLTAHTKWLFRHVSDTAQLLGAFTQRKGSGSVEWRAEPCRLYLDHVRSFLEKLLVLAHMSGGLPARAPELLGVRYANSGTLRNVFVEDGLLMLLVTYHKAAYQVGERPVARFLPPVIGQLLVDYLVLVLPFANFLSERLERTPSRHLLFHDGIKLFDAEKFSRVLERETALHLGVKIGLRNYRQMATAIDRRLLQGVGVRLEKGEYDGGEEESEIMVHHLQASHTAGVANRSYGNSIRWGNILTDVRLDEFRKLSRRWHVMIGLGPAAAAGKRPLSSGDQPQRGRKAAAVERRRWSSEDVRTALERLYGCGAQPKSPEQWQALSRMAEETPQMMVILPTGGGKSTLFLLGRQLRSAGTTVVIVPLVALKQDLRRRCQELGVSFSVWEGTTASDAVLAPLVFISVEHAVRSGFRSWCHRLALRNCLDRIILDEAHLVLTASSYRPDMIGIRELRRVEVPFIAMTATLPKDMEVELCYALHMQLPLIIRGPSDRPNLRYQVRGVRGLEDALERYRSNKVPSEFVLVHAVAPLIRKFAREIQDRSDRILCYTRLKRQSEELAGLLGCQAYHADVEDREGVLQGWIDGRASIILAGTSALSAGIDYAHVRYVFHVGGPDNLVDYIQETGRAGRDEKAALCVIWHESLPTAPAPAPAPAQPLAGSDFSHVASRSSEMLRMFLASTTAATKCRRQILTGFCDGNSGQTCSGTVKSMCDVCVHRMKARRRSVSPFDKTGTSSPPKVLEYRGEGGNSTSSKHLSNLKGGRYMAEESTRRDAAGLKRYGELLLRYQNLCWIEAFKSPMQRISHSSGELCRCEGQADYADYERTVAMDWEDFIGCFHCGNPSVVCSARGDGKICVYGKTVMRISWRLWKASAVRRVNILGRLGAPKYVEQYRRWLGKKSVLCGEEASNAGRVAFAVLSRLGEYDSMENRPGKLDLLEPLGERC